MKKFLKILLIAICVFSLIIGCKGGGDVKEEKKVKKLDFPEWFLTPPIANDAIYAVGFSKKSNPQMALTSAADWARQELVRVITVKVSTMTKQFLEEAGVDDITQSTDFSQVVSKSLASNIISGSKIQEQELKESGNKYAACVLVKLSLADMSGTVSEIVRANSSAYAKLQANKALEDLSKELEKLEANDFGRANMPEYE